MRIRDRRKDLCGRCGRFSRIEAHGWCPACYQRWRKNGRPAAGPPPSRRWKRDEERPPLPLGLRPLAHARYVGGGD